MSSSGSESGDGVKHVAEEEDTSLANSDVTTKYQEAAKIANAALEGKAGKGRTRDGGVHV